MMLINFRKPKKRLTAAMLHFGFSFSIFVLIVLLLKNIWYPRIYFETEGGLQGLKIVAGVDVILGPLLTLVVFNPQKSHRELTIDIGIIAGLQVIALIWGIYTLHAQRPVATVFWGNSFMTVPAMAFDNQAANVESFVKFSDEIPVIIYAQNPTNLSDLKKLRDVVLNDHIPPHHQTWLYRPVKSYFAEIKPYQLNIDEILAKHPYVKTQVMAILPNNSDLHDAKYFNLQSKYKNGMLVFDNNAKYLGAVVFE